MTMIGSILLNEIFNSNTAIKPSEILDRLNYLLLVSFQKEGKTAIKDGMDISFLSVEHNPTGNEHKLHWAGANNSMYVLKQNGKEILEVKADKQPIGYSEKVKPFTNHTISVTKCDTVILFSDGLPDQFGGPKGKKFMYRRFEETLLANSGFTMQGQGENLEKVFRDWKGSLEQVDDVTVIGVRI